MLAIGLLVGAASALAAPRANVNGSSYFIGGTYIEMGMNSGGAFGSSDAAPGGYHPSADYGGSLGFVNTGIAADFFLPGTPYEAFGAGYKIGGTPTTGECSTTGSTGSFTGTCSGLSMDGGYPTVATSGSNALLTSRHTLGSLRLTQQFSLPENEKYVEITLTAQNLSGSNMTDVRYVRDFDPDQGLDVCGSYNTLNTIRRTPSEHGFAAIEAERPSGCGSANSFVYLSTQIGAKGRVSSSGTDPYGSQWTGEQAAGTTNGGSDDRMAIMVPLGDIPAGQTKSATYYMLIDPAGINDFEANVLKTITTSVASGSGTVTPPTTSVAAGGTASFNLTGGVGWVPSTSVGGTCAAGSWSGNTYTTGVITDNCAISFNFQAATYTVSTSVAGSGSISPTSTTVTHGNTTSFTVTPNADNTIGTVSGCGGSLSGSTYTTGSITGACTVSVQFRANQTINFPNPGLQVFSSGGTFPLVATASSGLTVSFAGSSPSVCTVSGSTATMVAPGECVVTASQAGNASYNAAPNVVENIQVGRIPTTTSISSTTTGASSLTNEGFDVSVSVASQGVGDPTGSATVRALTVGGTSMGSCVATLGAPVGGVATGSCSIATGVLQPRDAVTRLVADYSGDDSDDISTSTDFAFSVLPGDVVITPVVSDVTVVSGEVISVTVALDAVAPALGPVTGDGTMAPDLQVSTSEAGTGCSIDWDLTNVCSLHFTGVNNTSQLLTAMQGGDPKAIAAAKASLAKTLSVSYLATTDFHAAGPTATDPVTVSSAPTTTLLSTAGVSSATDPSIYGEGIRLTAVVTADAPSTITPRGLVQFTRDSDVLGTVALDGSGIASFDAPPRTTGSEIYYAFFLTNDDFVGSDDDDEHSVAKSPTATLISGVSPPSPQALQTVTVSANVAAVAPGAGTPTGSIVISGDNTAGCTISLPAASCDLSFATKGSKTLTATYTGDSQFPAVVPARIPSWWTWSASRSPSA
ncbi:MAG: Ig-like domain repeat protein [Xanthomonadales bacterium]|nr:Ig-like domain repeat protein [Xanthomonadales bacterium]